MPERGPKLVCCGSAVLDHVFDVIAIPDHPTKVPASRYRQSGGGMAATGAVAAAALGGRAEFWGMLGTDATGTMVAQLLADAGVDISGTVRSDQATTPVSTVMVDSAGERLLAFYPGSRPAGAEKMLPLDRLAGARAVLADVRWVDGALAVLDAAGALGIPRILDVDVSPDPRLPELIARADHAIFSRGGLESVSGKGDPEIGLLRVRQITGGVVGVTLGADGFLWLDGSEMRQESAFQVAVRDTNGAGDTFHGAYALAIAEGRSIAAAARFANAAAALKCVNGGGWAGMPDRAEVESLIAEKAP